MSSDSFQVRATFPARGHSVRFGRQAGKARAVTRDPGNNSNVQSMPESRAPLQSTQWLAGTLGSPRPETRDPGLVTVCPDISQQTALPGNSHLTLRCLSVLLSVFECFTKGLRATPRIALASTLLVFLLAAAAPAPARAQTPNKLQWRTNYYSVTGASLGEIHRSMRQSRPWKTPENPNLVGLTEWRIDWRFEVKRSEDGCRCRSFTTTTSITNTLPRWTPPAGSAAELATAWSRFITALGEHEHGHSRLALAAVDEMHKRIKELGPATDCDVLRKRINDLAERVIEEHRQREKDYDRRTRHGETQGAALRY